MSDASPDALAALSARRDQIEELDRDIVRLISDRVRIAREVGILKRQAGQPTLDPAREAAVIRRAGTIARDFDLAEEDVREIFWHLIGLSRRAQAEDSR